jgi:hypothetical protein
LSGVLAHQQGQCAPTAWEAEKCALKLFRATDLYCRKELVAYAGCLQAGDSAACAPQRLAFDMCTEDF